MSTFRSAKSNYVAAFLLGAIIALLLNWPVRAADNAHSSATLQAPAAAGSALNLPRIGGT
jgi:hypothetical protein